MIFQIKGVEKPKEKIVEFSLVEDIYGITLKAKVKDEFSDWYILSINREGQVVLHRSIPEYLGIKRVEEGVAETIIEGKKGRK